ncbi:hypothetical protein [Marinibactrum halimedae]|uniref:Uncharacterized protein n=1 Tax=Marinibactrum halimedae TaxID=1444977 RepID=A0AA37T2E0_9GAMM|nr:hypothetical protein [Marinibactrum halimedae]MCD9458196.1 hypothetical protein [Marinibactrum halimedae]GLS25133.1 hypothetical protein GCM10007877_08470 [Marinibactrum halimedae]
MKSKKNVNNIFDSFLFRLNTYYHIDSTQGSYQYLYPLDWTLLDVNESHCLTYTIQWLSELRRNRGSYIHEYVFFISKDVFVKFSFHVENDLDSGCGEEVSKIIKYIVSSVSLSQSQFHQETVRYLNLKESFKPIKSFIWEEYTKCYGVDYSILDQYR